ncbi:MAG: hypothetical protein AB7G06_00360 [Bdellovibrionales bacterium]
MAAAPNPNETKQASAPPHPQKRKMPPQMGPRPLPAAPASFRNRSRRSAKGAWLTFAAFIATLAWFGIVGFNVIKAGGFTAFLESTGAAAIVAVTGLMLAPAAILWMMFAYMKRAYDVEAATEPLLKQLALITGQGGVAENRIRRFNDALAEQLNLLRQTSETTNRVAEDALATMRLERDELSQTQNHFTTDINILLNTMRGQTQQLSTLVETGQSQLSMIVQKTQDISETVNSQTDTTEARLTDLLAAISGTLDEVGRMADERIEHVEDVTDRMAARERSMRDEATISASSLEAAAVTVNEAMQGFKQLAVDGRNEADRLLATLHGQTEMLDSASSTMLGRISSTKGMVEEMAQLMTQTAERFAGSGQSVSDDLTERVAALSDAATALEVTASKISGMISDTTHEFAAGQDEVAALYADVINKLRAESTALTRASDVLAESAGSAQMRLQTVVSDLHQTTADSINNYEEAGIRVAEAMKARVSVIVDDAQRTTSDLKNVTEETLGAFEEASLRIGETMKARTEAAISDGQRAVQDLHRLAADSVDNFEEASLQVATAMKSRVEHAIGELQRTTSESLSSYESISAKAEAQAETVAENFNAAIATYEGAAKRLNSAATDLQSLATRCGDTLTFLDEKMSAQVEVLANVSDHVGNTSRNVKDDASALVATLQQMIDRLETVRVGVGSTTDTALVRLNDVANAASRQFTALESVASSALNKLEQAGELAADQTDYVEASLQKFERTYNAIKEESESTLSTLMQQLQGSCEKMGGMLDVFAAKTTELQPMLQREADKAAELATTTVETLSAQATQFGQKLAQENTRWASFVEDQSRAFADTFKELQKQLELAQGAHVELMRSSGAAADKIFAQTSSLNEVEGRINNSGRAQQEKLQVLKADLEKMLEFMQRQALSLGSITQQAVENVRGASEAFGEHAHELNTIAKVSETVLDDITGKMGSGIASAETLQTGLNALRNELMKVNEALDGTFNNLREEGEKTMFANDRMIGATRDGLQQLQAMTTALSAAAEQAVAARQTTVAELEAVNTRLADTTGNLTQSGRTAITAFTDAANLLQDKSDAVFGQLQKAADQLKATEATMGQLEKQATSMRSQLVDESENMIVALDKVTQDLTTRMANLRTVGDANLTNVKSEADNIATLLIRVSDDLQHTVKGLKDISTEAGSTLDDFGGHITNQVQSLHIAQDQLLKLCDGAVTGEGQLRTIAQELSSTTDQTRLELDAMIGMLQTKHETLAGQQSDVFAKLGETLNLLEKASNKLAGTGSDALEMATAVQARFVTVADYADKTVTEKAQGLALAASNAEQAMQNYATIAGSSTAAFAQQGQTMGTLVQNLRADLDATEERLASLADKITATSVASGAATQESVNRLQNAVTAMLQEFGKVGGAAEEATREIVGQTAAIRSEADAYGAGAREAAQQAASAFDVVRTQARETQVMLAGEVQKTLGELAEAEAKYHSMASMLGQSENLARTALSSLTHTFTDILETATRSLDQLKGEFETTALSAAGTLNQSQDVMAEKSHAFATLTEKLTGIVEALGGKSSTALASLQDLCSLMDTAQGRAAHMADTATLRLSELASTVEQRQQQLGISAEETTAKLTKASQDVLREVGGLVEQTLKADTQARTVAATITQAVQDAAQATGQFERDAERLSLNAQQAARTAEKATQMMQMGSDTAIKMLDESRSKLQDTSESVITTLEAETNRFRAATSLTEAQMERFAETVSAKAMDFLQVSENLAHQGQRLETQITHFAGTTLSAIERLQSAQTSAGSMTDDVVGKVENATDALADNIVRLDDHARNTAQTLEQTGRTVMTQATTLQQQAQLAEAQVTAVKDAIEELKGSASSLRGDIAGETEALTLALAKALAELESAGDTLHRQSQQTQQAVMQMNQTLTTSTRDLSEVTGHYQREQEQIRTNAQTVLADTARVLGEFYGFKNHMTSQVDDLAAQMAGIASNAEERMRKLSTHLQTIVGDIVSADTTLAKKLDTFGGDHQKLRSDVEKSVQLMATASGRLREVSSNAYAEIEDLTSRMANLRHAAGSEVSNQVTHLRNMVESASVLLHDLGKQLEGQTRTVETAHTDLVKRAGNVGDQTRNALGQLQALLQKLEDAKLSAGAVAEATTGKLASVLQQIESLDAKEDDTAEKVG